MDSASSVAVLVFYLPGVSPEYSKTFGKNTIFNEPPVCHVMYGKYINIKAMAVFQNNISV